MTVKDYIRSGGTWVGLDTPPTPPPPQNPTMWFGMFNNMPTGGGTAGDNTANFVVTRDLMGGTRCRVRRSFNSGFPTSWTDSASKDDWANGITPFWSFKISDVDGVIAGNYDTQLTNLGATIPNGTYVTSYHEPENDALFLGSNLGKFKIYSRRIYDRIKTGNPNIHYGYSALEYRYRSSFTDVGATFQEWSDRWYPGDDRCDWLTIDTYVMDWEAGGNLVTLQNMPGHMKWHNFAKTTGKPMGLSEWAIEKIASRTDSAVATHITSELAWLRDNGYFMALWWNGDGMGDGDFAISNRTASRTAWSDAAAAFGRDYPTSPAL